MGATAIMKKALVCGISGQDGTYLARLLLEKGYEVFGTSRDAQMATFDNLQRTDILDHIRIESMAPTDFRSVLQVMTKVKPDEVYNLAGQSSVFLSFEQPVETLDSISMGTLNLLEAIRLMDAPVRFYNASSGECFGDTEPAGATEQSPFRPRSPYAVAKCTAYWEVANYREAYGLFACSGILFNHESPLRPPHFVTKKIVSAACRIAKGSGEKLKLGDIAVERDWGWAPEYVEAIHRMIQRETPDDFVIATGRAFSLEEFVARAFEAVGLDWSEHVVTDPTLLRPTDIRRGFGNPRKAREVLGWEAKFTMPEVVKMMIEDELNQ